MLTMHSSWISWCMIALLIWCISAAPIDTSPSVEKFSIRRRDGVRPELGGVNFPGKLHYVAKDFKIRWLIKVQDPSIIEVDGIWYSFATRTIGSSIHIQVALSDDFDVWGVIVNHDGTQYDALPNLPQWVHPTSWNTWAPDVQRLVRTCAPTHLAQSLTTTFLG